MSNKKSYPAKMAGQVRWSIFINESGYYSLILSSKLKSVKKFKCWVTSQVLPSIRKYGYCKLFDNPNNHMFKIENEFDLHTKVVEYIRRFDPKGTLVATLGENQDISCKRINSWKQGYTKGSLDLLLMNYHKDYTGCLRALATITKFQKHKKK